MIWYYESGEIDALDGVSLTTILSIDPFILQDLQYKNYGATLTSRTMSEEEILWISQNPVITVGYLDDYLPYSDQDENGQPSGLVTDVISGIVDAHGLNNELTVQYFAKEIIVDKKI